MESRYKFCNKSTTVLEILQSSPNNSCFFCALGYLNTPPGCVVYGTE